MVKINLAEILGKRKMSRSDLSKITGIRFNTINDLYYEIAISIKIEHIKLICDALNCTSTELIEYRPIKRIRQKKKEQ